LTQPHHHDKLKFIGHSNLEEIIRNNFRLSELRSSVGQVAG
jgi:hypothetical protein